MKINELPKTVDNRKKRLGRGHGSGKVKTSGRGTKGQKARGKISLRLGLTGVSFVKRLPLFRGKSKNKSLTKQKYAVNLKYLNIFGKNDTVDIVSLVKKGIIDKGFLAGRSKIKILGDGEINIPLTVKLPCSNNARKKIENAGGKVEV